MAVEYEALKAEVVSIIKSKASLLGLTIPEGTETTLVNEVEEAICNYCNISQVPSELKHVWANMAIDLLRWYLSVAGTQSEGGTPSVSTAPVMMSSLKEGDTTIGFSADVSSQRSKAENAHNIAGSIDQVVMNYQDQLNRFRKVVW